MLRRFFFMFDACRFIFAADAFSPVFCHYAIFFFFRCCAAAFLFFLTIFLLFSLRFRCFDCLFAKRAMMMLL